MQKLKKQPIGLMIFILFAVAVLAGLYFFNLRQNKSQTSDNSTETIALSGTRSSLPIREWGVKIEFKDADKVKYLPSDTTSNQLKLFARGIALPSNSCSDLGIALIRSTNEPVNSDSTKAGNHFYYLEKVQSICSQDRPDSEQSVGIKERIISNGFTSGAYTITEL